MDEVFVVGGVRDLVEWKEGCLIGDCIDYLLLVV